MQVRTLEQANETLLEAERQTASELAQLVDQELLQVGGSCAWWLLLCG